MNDIEFEQHVQKLAAELDDESRYHISIPVEVFCRLVEESGTSLDGYRHAASRLKGCVLEEQPVVDRENLAVLLGEWRAATQ